MLEPSLCIFFFFFSRDIRLQFLCLCYCWTWRVCCLDLKLFDLLIVDRGWACVGHCCRLCVGVLRLMASAEMNKKKVMALWLFCKIKFYLQTQLKTYFTWMSPRLVPLFSGFTVWNWQKTINYLWLTCSCSTVPNHIHYPIFITLFTCSQFIKKTQYSNI